MTLKRELEDAGSPIRRFFSEHLPDTRAMTSSYRDALVDSITILPDPRAGTPPWSPIGHAISALLQWQLSPTPTASIAGLACSRIARHTNSEDVLRRYEEVVLAGPSNLDLDEASRVAWIAGLLDRVYRSGISDDPLLTPIERASDWDGLLAALPTTWTSDVAAMAAACQPIIEGHRSPAVVIDPIFAGSHSVGGADGDYIAEGGLLVDIKATKEPKLATRDLRQLISYALLDWDDQYAIRSIGILAVRQGRLVTWSLDAALSTMGSRDVTAQEMRSTFRSSLE
jgi:hypothetical protein